MGFVELRERLLRNLQDLADRKTRPRNCSPKRYLCRGDSSSPVSIIGIQINNLCWILVWYFYGAVEFLFLFFFTNLQIIPVHWCDEFQAYGISTVFDQAYYLVMGGPFYIFVTDTHDEVAFLHTAELKSRRTV